LCLILTLPLIQHYSMISDFILLVEVIGLFQQAILQNHIIYRGVRLCITYVLIEKVNPLEEHFLVVRSLSAYRGLYLLNITIWELEG
jgi:hypothetical protein